MQKILTLLILICLMAICFNSSVIGLTTKEIQVELDRINKENEPELYKASSTEADLEKTIKAKELMDPNSEIPNYDDHIIRENTTNGLALLSSSRGNGNDIPWKKFKNGYIILGTNGWCLWGYWSHAGIYDDYRETGHEYDKVFWSTWPRYGVVLQRKSHFHKYSITSGIKVKYLWSSTRNKCIAYVRKIKGRRYSILTNKRSNVYWYCSKVPWKAYRLIAKKDIDSNRGYWVTPDNLWHSSQTIPFAYGQ